LRRFHSGFLTVSITFQLSPCFILCFGVLHGPPHFQVRGRRKRARPWSPPLCICPTNIQLITPGPLIHISFAGEDDWDSISRVKSSTVGSPRIFLIVLFLILWPFFRFSLRLEATIILKESWNDRGHSALSFVTTRTIDVTYLYIRPLAANLSLSGAAYMSGAVMGGAFGMLQGARAASKLKMVSSAPSACSIFCLSRMCSQTLLQSSQKMRLNQVFNGVGRHSPVWAGNLGVVSILFTMSQRGIQYWRSDQEDSLNTICGASLAGALFKCAASPGIFHSCS
jgi:hypothetical protein